METPGSPMPMLTWAIAEVTDPISQPQHHQSVTQSMSHSHALGWITGIKTSLTQGEGEAVWQGARRPISGATGEL